MPEGTGYRGFANRGRRFMNIIVIGGAGYLGSRLIMWLLGTGNYVTVLDRMDHYPEALLGFAPNKELEIIKGDAREYVLKKGFWGQFDAVINLAAVVGEKAYSRSPSEGYEINRNLPSDLAQIMGPKLLQISTCSVYGVQAQGIVAVEDTAPNPQGGYAQSKLIAEKKVLNCGSTVLRFGTLCGPSLRPRFDLLINDLARHAATGKLFTVFGKRAYRPYLHTDDAAAAICEVLKTQNSGKDTHGLWNVVSVNRTKEDLIQIAEQIVPNFQVAQKTGQADPRDYSVSGAKFEKEFHWSPRKTIPEAFKEAYIQAKLVKDPWAAQWANN